MIEQAKAPVSDVGSSNVDFFQASAENLVFTQDSSVDLITAGQASRWFDHGKTFKELSRVVRSGGSMAYWGYKDHVFVNFAVATKIMDDHAYSRHSDMLGSCWQQPGRSIVQNLLRDIVPPESDWKIVQRMEYEPGIAEKGSGVGHVLMSKTCRVKNARNTSERGVLTMAGGKHILVKKQGTRMEVVISWTICSIRFIRKKHNFLVKRRRSTWNGVVLYS